MFTPQYDSDASRNECVLRSPSALNRALETRPIYSERQPHGDLCTVVLRFLRPETYWLSTRRKCNVCSHQPKDCRSISSIKATLLLCCMYLCTAKATSVAFVIDSFSRCSNAPFFFFFMSSESVPDSRVGRRQPSFCCCQLSARRKSIE